MNNKNLKTLTHNEAVKQGRKGGIASGISRNKNKGYIKLLQEISTQQITDLEAKKELAEMGLDTDIRNHIFLKVYKQATVDNNSKALLKLFDAFYKLDDDVWL